MDDRLLKVAKAWAADVRADAVFEDILVEAKSHATAFLAMFDAAHSCCKEVAPVVAVAVKSKPEPKAAPVDPVTTDSEKAPK